MCVIQVEVGLFGGVGYGVKAKADVNVSLLPHVYI